jgi:hypothetical protein
LTATKTIVNVGYGPHQGDWGETVGLVERGRAVLGKIRPITIPHILLINLLLKEKADSLEQCCPTFLCTWAQLTDAYGGAGATTLLLVLLVLLLLLVLLVVVLLLLLNTTISTTS